MTLSPSIQSPRQPPAMAGNVTEVGGQIWTLSLNQPPPALITAVCLLSTHNRLAP